MGVVKAVTQNPPLLAAMVDDARVNVAMVLIRVMVAVSEGVVVINDLCG